MFNACAVAPSPDGKRLTERAVAAVLGVHLRPADRARSPRPYDLDMGFRAGATREELSSADGWRECTSQTRRDVTCDCSCKSYGSASRRTRVTYRTKEYETNGGVATGELLVAARAQRGVKNITTLNRLVAHGSKLDMCVLVREETGTSCSGSVGHRSS